MEVQALKQLIQSDNIPSFMIFTGDEWKIQQLYIQQIAKVRKLEVEHIEAVSDILPNLNARSLFSVSKLYVVRDDKEFMSEEKLQKRVLNSLKQNMLILQLTTVDKRLKIIKSYNDSIVEFNELNEAILKRYIQRESNLSDVYINLLLRICENNYGRCLLELDKMKYYKYWAEMHNYDMDYDEAFDCLMEDGAIYIPPKDAVFDLVKAVLQNKPQLAFELYNDCKDVGEATLVILTNLYNTTKQVLQVQTCKTSDIAKTTGLTAWQIKHAKELVGYYKAGELSYLMRLIQKVEKSIKTGEIEEAIAVDYVLTNFL